MATYKKVKSKVGRWLISQAVARQPVAMRMTEELKRVSPESFIDSSILRGAGESVVAMLSEEQKEAVLKNSLGTGKSVVAMLSEEQKEAVLKDVCQRRLGHVIDVVNGNAGGSFKYVGRDTVRVIIGSGAQKLDGWFATDIDKLNIVEEASWRRLFNPGDIERLLAEHVFEHLTLQELHLAFRHAFTYLKPGGALRLAVPDAFHPSRYYYNLVKPGGWETPFEHMLFLDHEILERVAQSIGFEVRLLEYFDERGVFHEANYSASDGPVQRCARNNSGLDVNDETVMRQFHASIPEHLRSQFTDRGMSYTSLIADLVKPS